MSKKQQQLIINLDEYVTYQQKLEVVESVMELLDLEFDREGQVIMLKRHNEDLLQQVMDEFDRTHKK